MEELELLRENCCTISNKLSNLEQRLSGKSNLGNRKIEDYSRVITPLAAFPNGDLANKVDFGEVKYYNSFNATSSTASSGIVPLEDNKYAPGPRDENMIFGNRKVNPI